MAVEPARHGVRRRRLLEGGAATVALLASGCVTRSAPAPRVIRIGALTNEALPTDGTRPPVELDVMDGLRAEGFVDGQNLEIDWRHSEGKREFLPVWAKEFVVKRVDILIASTTGAVLAAKEATDTIPIVMQGAADAKDYHAVDDYAHPGGNITGTAFDNTAEGMKRLELFHQAFPTIRRVLILGITPETVPLRAAKLFETGALLGIEVTAPVIAQDKDDDLVRALDSVGGGGGLVTSATLFGDTEKILAFATAHRIPGVYSRPENVDAGGLMSFGANRRELRTRVGRFVRQIVDGIAPGDLPVEVATRFDLVVNLAAADRAGFTIPRSVLDQATTIIR